MIKATKNGKETIFQNEVWKRLGKDHQGWTEVEQEHTPKATARVSKPQKEAILKKAAELEKGGNYGEAAATLSKLPQPTKAQKKKIDELVKKDGEAIIGLYLEEAKTALSEGNYAGALELAMEAKEAGADVDELVSEIEKAQGDEDTK